MFKLKNKTYLYAQWSWPQSIFTSLFENSTKSEKLPICTPLQLKVLFNLFHYPKIIPVSLLHFSPSSASNLTLLGWVSHLTKLNPSPSSNWVVAGSISSSSVRSAVGRPSGIVLSRPSLTLTSQAKLLISTVRL